MKKKLNYSPSPIKRPSKPIHQNTHWSFERSIAYDSPSKQHGNKNQSQLQLQSVLDLSENFKKKILMNVQLLDSIQQRSMPQRCQLHNNIFSLYCETQRKPLCASCVYQNDAHRKHNVIPVNQSAQLLKEDVNRSREKLDNFITQLSKTIKERQRAIEQIQQQYPHYIVKLQKHYTNLHEILVRKEREQINQIRYFKDKVRYENAAIATQLNQITCFLIQKLQRSAKVTDENALAQYRILSCLNSAQGFLKKSMELMPLNRSIVNSKNFATVGQYLTHNLQLNFPQQVANDQYLKQTTNSKQNQQQKNHGKSQKYLKSSSSMLKQSNSQNSNQKLLLRTNLSSEKLKSTKDTPVAITPDSVALSKEKIATKTQVQKPKKVSSAKNNNKTQDPYHMTFSPNKNNSFSQIKNNKSGKSIKKQNKTPPKGQSKKQLSNKKTPQKKSPDRSKSKTPEIGTNKLKTNNSLEKKKQSPPKVQAENARHEKPKVTCIYHASSNKKDKSPTPNKKKPQ